MGSANAAVLPVPVCAMPSRSRPSVRMGMDCTWIGVGFSIIFGLQRELQGLGKAEAVERRWCHYVSLYALARQPHVMRGSKRGRYASPHALI